MNKGTNHNDTQGDDLLERAIDAIKHERMPNGPSQDVIARTLATLKSAPSHNERKAVVTRILHMTFAQRIAAAVLLAGGALVLWFMFALLGGGTVSYAQVAQQIKDARTMTFKMTTSSPQLTQPVEAKLYAMEPGMLRNEGPGGIVTISRREGDRIRLLALEPKSKTARMVEANVTDAGGKNPDFVATFRALAEQPGEPLDDRQVGDVKAKGFKVVVDGRTISLWVHPKTALPLLVEMGVPSMEDAKVVLSEIAFDAPLDARLFSLDVPEGYKLSEQKLNVTIDLETNVINLMRAYTKASGGAFPEKLNDWSAYSKAVAPGKGNPEDARATASAAGALTAVLSGSKPGEDYAYTGKDARLGEKDKIIFWHRDKDKGTYRAIFGDLTARDVPADQIRKNP